jgi:hypothetical protein
MTIVLLGKVIRYIMSRFHPSFEQFEARILQTLVFVFNGNAFAASQPNVSQTGLAALRLTENGDRAIQLSTQAMDDPGDFYRLAGEILARSKGQPIGLMGFSAGGSLAMRLSGVADLNVKAVMNFYGPPDLRDWLKFHRGDRFFKSVTSHVHFDSGIIKLLSGPSSTTAYIVSAFGLDDHNVVSGLSTVGIHHDFQKGEISYYPGPHGVTIYADYPAFEAFLAHL